MKCFGVRERGHAIRIGFQRDVEGTRRRRVGRHEV